MTTQNALGRRILIILLGVGSLGAALLLAHGMASVVDPLVVWGGTACDDTHGFAMCAGYPPLGLGIAMLVVAVPLSMAIGWLTGEVT